LAFVFSLVEPNLVAANEAAVKTCCPEDFGTYPPQHLGPLSSPQHMASPNAYVNESFGISSPSSPYQQPYGNMVDFLPGPATLPSPVGSNAVSPEQQKTFLDGLNMSAGSYQNQYPHMLLAN
jgi:hypothetical protein